MAGARLFKLAACLLLAIFVFIGGCSPSVPATPVVQPSTATSDDPAASHPNDSPPSPPAVGPPAVTGKATDDRSIAPVDEQGRKWLGEIPYDVWFDDPLSLVADDEPSTSPPLNPNTTSPTPEAVETVATAPPNATTPQSQVPPSAVGSAPDWPNVISADVLADEVKRIHNRLAAAARSVGQFNRAREELMVDGATLAALGEIADRHPEDIRWKRNAGYIREAGVHIAESAQNPGKESFDATRAAFDELGSILNGSTPAGSEPAKSPVFADFADRGLLMKRIETAFEWLRKNTNSDASLAGQSEAAAHEASLLAALSTVISTAGYSLADEPDYAAHAAGLAKAAAEAARAAKEPKFPEFSAALATAQNTCTQCHRVYRFGE